MIAHAFGRSGAWTVGVEEELFVLDARSLGPAPFPSDLLDGTRLKPELFTPLVELNTSVCASVEEAAGELRALRAEAKRGAGDAGLALAAVGTWPPAVPDDQPVTENEGFLRFVDYAGPTARRQFCAGLHVHVGMPTPERCLEALEAVLPWLPLVLAVSANSPYLEGRETGLASTRAEILALLPRSGAPPVFRSYRDWQAFAERLIGLGLADSYRRLWWDVRPHPQLGTLEVRMPDQPTSVEVSVAFAALLQALAASARSGEPADRGIYQQNRWAALRFGRGAELVHPDGSCLVGVAALLAELVERVAPAARRLGTETLLARLDGLAQAEEQLDLGRREGLPALCRRLVAHT